MVKLARMPKSKSKRRKGKAPSGAAPAGAAPEWEMAHELAALIEEDPIEAAAQLVDLAWEVDEPSVRRDCALKALEIDPLCSDALLVLAEHLAEGSDSRHEILQAALGLAETRLGNEAFETYAGEFWLSLETRPYMRARVSLAECLRAAGDLEGARHHYEAMLELCPNDNLGVRYILATTLHLTEKLDELEALLRRYEDEGSTFWTYAWALLDYKRSGVSPSSDERLTRALAANAFVPDYLLSKRKLPGTSPDYYSPGERNEAQFYARDNSEVWRRTPSALHWLDRRAKRGRG
jgi:tetratricopeptide (TPR) repeat protein